jgi:hypothetical protein
MGGNELNPTAIKNIIWNILDERPHKSYLNKTHETALVQRQLLQILATGTCHQALAITNLATNSYCAAVSLSNPMRAPKVKALDHISKMIHKLSVTSNINMENHADAIAKTVIDMLELLLNEGNQPEIKGANRLIKSLLKPNPH